VVAEQIGAQIFIDGWAMVAPGDPELAVELAGRAASVSHDGEAVLGAQVLAAMEAQAFVESDLNRLIDIAVSFIPKTSVIFRMIEDLREWHAQERDWRVARQRLAAHYGYDKFGGNCHVVPNHGLILHSLLYGDDDFQKTLMIVNTSGWDTDCNSGNVGCLMGIKNGLAGIDAGPDWRGPVADRMYLPAADGGRAITDAVTETFHVVNLGRALAGEERLKPKNGARYHFELPGAVQGFHPEDSIESRGTARVANVLGHSKYGERSLALHFHHVATGRSARVATATFIPPDADNMPGYRLLASPTLYPGQVVRAGLGAAADNPLAVHCHLYLRAYDAADELVYSYGPDASLSPGEYSELEWLVGDTHGSPIAEIGLEISSDSRADGTVYLDYLTWDGMPNVTLTRCSDTGRMWRNAWVDAVDHFSPWGPEPFRLIQNSGTGMLMHGTREWEDYRITADVTPHMVEAAGIAARVQGLCRYYALLISKGGKAQLVKVLDGENVLAEEDFAWEAGKTYELSLEVKGSRLHAWIDGRMIFEKDDLSRPLRSGAIALVCKEGRTAIHVVHVRPAD
jgi:hypothetical protein